MTHLTPTTRIGRTLITSIVTAGWLASPMAYSPTPVEAAFPGYNGKIAFVSTRDGNDEIYLMTADGGNQMRLTNNSTVDKDPAWSPDGTKIAFTSNRDGNNEIYVMNADGSNQIRLTNNTASETFPSWSPNSQKILFSSTRTGHTEIYTMDK